MARAVRDNLHSRLVFALKVVLPLLALVLLSTLFLISRKITPEDAIPFAEVDIEDRFRDPKMTGAGLAGMTADGSAISLSVGEAKPDTGSGARLQQVFGSLTTPDGVLSELAAAAMSFDAANREIVLSKGAEFRSALGYSIASDKMTVATDLTRVESPGPVIVDGPVGQLTADQMQFSRQGGKDGPFVLVFKGQVRLIYEPQR